jgi:hypothetical protein
MIDCLTKRVDMSGMATLLAQEKRQALETVIEQFNPALGDLAELFANISRRQSAQAADLPGLRRALRLRGTEAQQRIQERAKPLLTTAEFCQRRGGITRQSAHEQKHKGQALAVQVPPSRGDFFPEFQLDGTEVRPWVPELLGRIKDPWSALSFLTSPRTTLAGESHLQRILRAAPKAIETMLAEADEFTR